MTKPRFSATATRLTALAIALVFCVGMFAPMAMGSVPEMPAQSVQAASPQPAPAADQQPADPVIMAVPEPEEPETIIIQPNATAGKDAIIWTSFPEANYGILTTLPVGNGTIERRSLVEFEIPPTTGVLIYAALEMYSSAVTNGPCNISVNAISAAWDEGTLSGGVGAVNWSYRTATQPWAEPAGDFYAAPSSYQTVPVPNAWYSWDVTALVSNWLSGTWVNNGFILTSNNPNPAVDNIARFLSSDDAANPGLRPRLILSYAAEITDPVPSQTFLEDAPARTIPLNGRGAGSVDVQTPGGGNSNNLPFWGVSYDELHVQYLYNSSEIGAEGVLRRMSFNRFSIPGPVGRFDSFAIRMAHTDLDVLTDTFANNYNGVLLEVFPAQTVFVNSSDGDQWVHFLLNGSFTYDSAHNLLVDISWSGDSGNSIGLHSNDPAPGRRLHSVVLASATGNVQNSLPVARFLVDAADNAVFDKIDPAEDGYYAPFSTTYVDVHMQFLYNQTMINQGGLIDRIAIQHLYPTSDWLLMHNCTIRLAHAAVDSLTMTYEDNRDGPWVTVVNDADVNLTGSGIGNWMMIDIDNLFTYDNARNLLIDLSFQSAEGTGVVNPTDNATIGYNGRLYGDIGAAAGSDLSQVVYGFQAIMADSSHLTWSATSSDPTLFTASVAPGTGNLVITPQPDQFGAGTVSLRLTNTKSGDVATQVIPITINAVNDGPILAPIPDQACTEDIPFILNVAPYMSDIDNDVYSLVVTENSAHATVSGTNITFLYPEGVSNETVSVEIRDPGALTDSQTFDVTVTQINDEPYLTGFPASVACDATVTRTVNLNPGDEETADNSIMIYTDSEYANITGHTLRLLYPKGVGSDRVNVYVVDELTYGVQNNVTYVLNVTITDHPDVIANSPTGTLVPIVSPVQVTFDAEMNRTKAENAFSLKLGTTELNGTFSWNAAGTVMTFTPPGYMAAGTYDVSVAASAEDIDGVRMLGAYSWNFTVAYADYDGDGMADEWEIENGLDPLANDAAGDLDGDGLPNDYEFDSGLDPGADDADEDADGDGATNLEEYEAETDPNDPEDSPSEYTWIIMVLVLVVVAVIVLVAVLLLRRGKKPEPQEPEQWQQEPPAPEAPQDFPPEPPQ